MEPLYNVGDTVLIKSKYDPGKNCYDYRFSFVDEMLDNFGGNFCTICKKKLVRKVDAEIIPDDGYLYTLKGNDWNWASSMFEPEF